MTYTAVELRPPTTPQTDLEGRMEFIQQQLDSIGTEKTILNGLQLLGNGRNQRLQGGALSASMPALCTVHAKCDTYCLQGMTQTFVRMVVQTSAANYQLLHTTCGVVSQKPSSQLRMCW
jgi:hypothetical protein